MESEHRQNKLTQHRTKKKQAKHNRTKLFQKKAKQEENEQMEKHLMNTEGFEKPNPTNRHVRQHLVKKYKIGHFPADWLHVRNPNNPVVD